MCVSVAKIACALLLLCLVLETDSKKENKKIHVKKDKLAKSAISYRGSDCRDDEFACPEKCIDQRWVCDSEDDCDNGLDEANCTAGCTGPNKFECNNTELCLPAGYNCDGEADCSDGSDEVDCPFGNCDPGDFPCANGYCIYGYWYCDGDNDCGDFSDEVYCPDRVCNETTEFTCNNTRCVNAEFECDTDNDCGDRSDEMHCSCNAEHFACATGGCIPARYRCDGDNDCGDLSDEAHCPDMHPEACGDKLTWADCMHMNTTTMPLCLQHVDAHKYCRKFCGLCKVHATDAPNATDAPML